MTVLPIQITGSPVLHHPAQPVSTFTDDLHRLVADMVETMHEAPGVGLAAPQVGVGLQVFVWDYDDGAHHYHGHVVNPTLRRHGWPAHRLWGTPDEEGCLSIPGQRAPLARYPRVTLHGHTVDGDAITLTASGWLARIFQHEYDHLQGVLYRDRLRRRYRAEVDQAVRDNGWGEPGHTWNPGSETRESDFFEDD